METKLYDKRDDFSFPIVNFLFLSSNILAAPVYGVYISQLIRYYQACIYYHDFLDRGLLLTRKLLNQEFKTGKLKSSLREFKGRHHELVDLYGITVSLMIQICSLHHNYNPLLFYKCDLPNLTIYRIWYIISNPTGATYGAGSAYPSGAPEITPSFGGVRVVYSLVFYVVSCVLLFVYPLHF